MFNRPVLSNILGLNSASTARSPLVFADPRLESSLVISALLRLLYDHKIPPLYEFFLVQDLVDLADKWEITVVDDLVRKELITSISLGHDHESPFELFMIAIKLNDINLAARVIQTRDGHDVLHVLIGRADMHWINIFTTDLDDWEYQQFTKIPPKVSWALQRAAMMWDHGYGTSTTSYLNMSRRQEAIGANFRRIMDPSCAFSPPFVVVSAERRSQAVYSSSAW